MAEAHTHKRVPRPRRLKPRNIYCRMASEPDAQSIETNNTLPGRLMTTESMPLSGIFSCVRLWIFLGTKKHRIGDKFMKKQTIKTIVTALTAAAMVCSLTGCAGNSSGATETLNAEKSSAAENTEAAAGVEQENE